MPIRQVFPVVGVIYNGTLTRTKKLTQQTLSFAYGDSGVVRATVYNTDGTAPTLTGLTLLLNINVVGALESASPLVQVMGVVSNGNQVDFTLTAAQIASLGVGTFEWDFLLNDGQTPPNISHLNQLSTFFVTATASGYVIPAAPTIASLSVYAGPTGTSEVITGTGYENVESVDFNGTAAASYVVNSPTQITAAVAAGTTPGPVHVITALGTATGPNFLVQDSLVLPPIDSGGADRGFVLTVDETTNLPEWEESTHGLPNIDGGGADNNSVLGVVANAAVWLAAYIKILYFAVVAQNINHGQMWVEGQQLLVTGEGGTWATSDGMYYEMWGQGNPWEIGKYWFSDGYGGNHALLDDGQHGNITFLISGAATPVTSESDQPPPPGVFSHMSVLIVGDNYGNRWIEHRCNGVLIGRTAVPVVGGNPVPRCTIPINEGGGIAYIGGSDHSNFAPGWIAMVRGWDNVLPASLRGIMGGNICPQRNFGADDGNGIAATFLVDYTGEDKAIYPDLSSGYNSNVAERPLAVHPGNPYYADYGRQDSPMDGPPTGYPLPSGTYVPVSQCPFARGYTPAPVSRGFTPSTPPGSCKIFDSFSRADQELAHCNVLSLGSTEAGSLGPLAWQPATLDGSSLVTNPLGVFNRSLTLYQTNAVALVPNNSADMTISATRVPSAAYPNPSSGLGNIALVGRQVSAATAYNGYLAVRDCVYGLGGSVVDCAVYLFRYDFGVRTVIGEFSDTATSTWAVMSLVFSGSTIEVKLDGVTKITVTDSTYGGLLCGIAPNPSGQTYDFTVD